MIEHIVAWKIRPEVTEEQLNILDIAIMSMNGAIPGVKDIIFRKSITPERGNGFTHVLRCYVETEADLAIYAVHPLHVKVKEIIQKLTTPDGVIAFDITL